MKLIIFNERLTILKSTSFQSTVKTKFESNWGFMIMQKAF